VLSCLRIALIANRFAFKGVFRSSTYYQSCASNPIMKELPIRIEQTGQRPQRRTQHWQQQEHGAARIQPPSEYKPGQEPQPRQQVAQ
jgi:hypothetical protein